MNQVLHIFRKDTRRFWPEILLSLFAAAAFVLIIPYRWQLFQDQFTQFPLMTIAGFVPLLVAIAWWLLITRVVHAEGLVADNEFWITRPYQWHKLLAAKLFFLAVWVYLPYLLAELLLLSEARFHPLSYLPGLLLSLFLASAFLLLPLLSVAAVTSNFARMTLTLLGGFLLLGALAFLLSLRHGYLTSVLYRGPLFYVLGFCGCAIAITLQYATRRVWLSRAAIVATAVIVILAVTASRGQFMVDRIYPQPGPASTQQIVASLISSPIHPAESRIWQSNYFIDLPIRFSGVADGYAVFANNFKFTLTAADGSHWTSPWQGIYERNFSAPRSSELSLQLKPATFDRFKSAPITLSITFALTRLQAGSATQMPFPTQDFAAPGIGFCTPRFDRSTHSFSDALLCRSALRQPAVTYVSALWTNTPCSNPPELPRTTLPGGGWMGNPDLNEVDFDFTPVQTPNVFFRMDEQDGREPSYKHWLLCPGSPLTFTPYYIVERTQTSFTMPNFQIPTNVIQTGY